MSEVTDKNIEQTITNNDNDNSNNSTTLNEENLKIDNEDEDEIDEDDNNVPTYNYNNNIKKDDLKVPQTPIENEEHKDKIEPTPLTPRTTTTVTDETNILKEEDVADTQSKKQEEQVKEESFVEEEGEADEAEGDEEDEGETRCICGELDPPDESGLFIQCEQCGVWQHGFCVGITNEDTPDKYWCEQCKPELHRLYVTDLGDNRSIYKPVQNIRRSKKRLSRQSSSSSSNGSKKGKNGKGKTSEESTEPSSPTLFQTSNDNNKLVSSSSSEQNNDTTLAGSRSTRSRDNDIPQTNSTTTTATAITGPLADDNERTNDSTLINQTIKSSQLDSTNTSSHGDNDEPSSTPYDEDDRRLQDRKRATFLAREEKQYQRMLEKAIKESKRASGDSGEDLMMDEDEIDEDEVGGNDTASTVDNTTIIPKVDANTTTDDIKQPKAVMAKKLSTVNEELNSSAQDSIRSETPDQLSETSSSVSLKRVPTPVRKSQRGVKRPRRAATPTERVLKGGRRGKSTRTTGGNNPGTPTETGSTQSHVSRTNSEVNLNKPVKPRLPPARTTLNEMRRRTSAILEFISRTQWELSEDQQTKEDLIKFVENDEFINKVNGVYDKYNESLSLMDDLTRNLLLWEQKYSFNKNTNASNDEN